METKSLLKHIRDLIAKDEIGAAIIQLQQLLAGCPKLDEALLQSARLKDILRQIRLGIVDDKQANLVKNQIRSGVLDLLREIDGLADQELSIREEMATTIQTLYSKNVVSGNISAGGSVHIGDIKTTIERQVNLGAGNTYVEQQTVMHTEDRRSRYLKYALFGFALPGTFLFLLYWYFVLSRPFNLTVSVNEAHPIPGQPFEKGRIYLRYADKTDTQDFTGEYIFKQLPASQKGEPASLHFESPGYQSIDTVFTLGENLLLPIRRDNTLGAIQGIVKSHSGETFIVGALVMIDNDVTTITDSLGRFRLQLPLNKQRDRYLITVKKEGFKPSSDYYLPKAGSMEIRVSK